MRTTIKIRKSIKPFLAAIIIASTVILSCEKDDKNEYRSTPSSLIGTWEHNGSYEWGDFLWRITFLSDFTGTDFYKEYYFDESYSGSDEFTWSVSGNNLTILYEEGDLLLFKYSISGNHLTMTSEEDEKMVFLKQ